MSEYRYKAEPTPRNFGPLPAGDYTFEVLDVIEPKRSEAGNLVLSLKLAMQPGKEIVWANPWCGETSAGEERDHIAEFLLAVNRAPKIGQEPDWPTLIGARGRCRLKVETATLGALAGKEVNRVESFFRPKQLGLQSYTQEQVEQTKAATRKRAGGQLEPEDIPF